MGQDVIDHCVDSDEIWHAGDIGDMVTAQKLEDLGPTLRMVWGNIDDKALRNEYEKDLVFTCAGVKIFMTHIGGYPGRYYKSPHRILQEQKPDVFICGHSHILKVMPDRKLGLLHMNPGACGIKGFHKFRTLLKFEIIGKKVTELKAIELGLRSTI